MTKKADLFNTLTKRWLTPLFSGMGVGRYLEAAA